MDDVVAIGGPGREFTTSIVQAWHKHVGRQELFFPGLDLHRLEADMAAATAALGLDALHLTLHVVRHSGPSNDVMLKRLSLQRVQKRGRWRSFKPLVRYERHAKIMRQAGKVRPHTWALTKSAKKRIRSQALQYLASVSQMRDH